VSPAVQVLLAALGTYLLRASLVILLGRVEISERIEAGLKLVAPAVLAALVAQTLIFDGDQIRGIGAWHLAAVVAAGVGWRWRSVAWTLVVGMGVLWLATSVGIRSG